MRCPMCREFMLYDDKQELWSCEICGYYEEGSNQINDGDDYVF